MKNWNDFGGEPLNFININNIILELDKLYKEEKKEKKTAELSIKEKTPFMFSNKDWHKLVDKIESSEELSEFIVAILRKLEFIEYSLKNHIVYFETNKHVQDILTQCIVRQISCYFNCSIQISSK
jgi:hypothetical protein